MLRAIPQGWFSSKYTVLENDTTIANIDFSGWREAGELTIKGSPYRVYREGMMSGSFLLESAGSIHSRAEKPSALYRSFLVEHDGKKYTLEAKSAWSRNFILSEGGAQVGSVHSEGALSRKAVADFPEQIPLAVRIFMLWLVMVLWKRSDSASSG